jgi:hypothetical protein
VYWQVVSYGLVRVAPFLCKYVCYAPASDIGGILLEFSQAGDAFRLDDDGSVLCSLALLAAYGSLRLLIRATIDWSRIEPVAVVMSVPG